VLYRDPLTGEPLEEPHTTRLIGLSINNVPGALPHVGTDKAGIIFEMYINDYATRCLALFSDLRKAEDVGSIRSMRYNFTDLGIAYDAIVGHAGGSDKVLYDANKSGVTHIHVAANARMSYRDKDRMNSGYAFEHTLFVDGPGMFSYLEDKGYKLAHEEEKSYGLNFVDDGTPADGETANVVNITFRLYHSSKLTTMTYREELGKYICTQYGQAINEENLETFENVFVIITKVRNNDIYHVAELMGSGDGYYACGGKIIPIRWVHENETDPITFTLADGTPLEQGVGNSYVAIVPLESTVEWE
jgi:hypothetical protein